MPCYALDGELKKHDLNPLIKISGAYLVDDSDPESSLFINVCRDIGLSPGGRAPACGVVEGFSRSCRGFALCLRSPTWVAVALRGPLRKLLPQQMLSVPSPPLGPQGNSEPSQIPSELLVPAVCSLCQTLWVSRFSSNSYFQ